jgi:galactose oxidase
MFLRTLPSLLTLLAPFLARQSTLVGAVTTALAPQNIDRQGWVITADSFQSESPPGNAIDNNDGTIWHSAFNPVVPLPHWLRVDMQNQYVVNGLSYTPRQDGSPNGRIGTHRIEYSLDGNTWTLAAQGTWGNDAKVKTTLFTPVVARYLRLTALDEATNTGKQFISAAEIDVLRNPHAWLPRQNWVVTVDSSQGGALNFPAANAYDSSPTTYWHTDWSGTPGFPHYFSIDQGAANTVAGISYLPRPVSSGSNGRIGRYTVQRSDNGNTWTDVASGTWPDSPIQKYAEWTPVTARYWRLVAQSEAGNRGTWTSASEINLLDGAVSLANFRITVDSEETAAVNNSAVKAMDTDISTFWHTQWSGANIPGYPHYFTVDMMTNMPVKALEYTPRQDGSLNGNIGQHRIEVSSDNTTWTTVATGNYADNAQAKLTFFQETVCRYVRLTALTEAGNRGPWASASEISLQYDTNYVPPAPQTKGQWALTVNFPVVPVAVGLLYNTGGVLAWSSWSESGFGNTPNPGYTIAATYDTSSGSVSKARVSNTQHDMFCPGISLDFNGRFLITGGNSAAKSSIYSPAAGNWIAAPNMVVARGYQSSTTLSNGWIFQIGGSWSGGVFKKNGEYYNPSTNTWNMLSGADVTPMLTADPEGIYRSDNHGWLFAWKNQAVLQAGPSKAMIVYVRMPETRRLSRAMKARPR